MVIKRIAQIQLENNLKHIGAVLVTGPKYSGKTFLSQMFANSKILIDRTVINQFSQLGKTLILYGETPRLIDEWQWIPEIWDLVRYDIDSKEIDKQAGSFILTGSSSPKNSEDILHSGAGRILKMYIQTLTFAEILHDISDYVSLRDLFDKKYNDRIIESKFTFDDVNKLLIKGGWPYVIANNFESSDATVNSYIESITNPRLEDLKYYGLTIDKRDLKKILTSIARVSAAPINKSTILNDIKNIVSKVTLDKYICLLYDICALFDVPVWKNSNIRSTYRFKNKPKTYFCDTSIICRLLNVTNVQDCYNDLNTTGILFETQVMKDLLVYAQALDGELFYYKNENDDEIDAIIELKNGKWCAIEIKLSLEASIKAIPKLLTNIKKLEMEGKHKDPEFVAVITNCERTFKTKDGVYIIPHTLLKPF